MRSGFVATEGKNFSPPRSFEVAACAVKIIQMAIKIEWST